MRRIPFGLTAGLVSAVLVSVVLVGCGGPTDKDDEQLPRRKTKSKAGPVASGAGETLKSLAQDKYKYEGTISGAVKWAGDKPDLDKLTKDLQAGMIKDTDYCLSGKEYEKAQQTYRIGKNDNLGNVFVWIQPLAGHAFDVPDAQLPAVKEVRLHQPHCAFLPHCVVLFASRYKNGDQDPAGCQKFAVVNDARITHNAKIQGGPLNGAVNKLLGPSDSKGKMQEEVLSLKPEKDAVTVSCDVHTWMRAYVRVFDHPYAAVSSVGADLSDAKKPTWENLEDSKFGTFEIKGVPVGARVRLFAWHEQLGYLTGTNGKEITLAKENKLDDITAQMKK